MSQVRSMRPLRTRSGRWSRIAGGTAVALLVVSGLPLLDVVATPSAGAAAIPSFAYIISGSFPGQLTTINVPSNTVGNTIGVQDFPAGVAITQ